MSLRPDLVLCLTLAIALAVEPLSAQLTPSSSSRPFPSGPRVVSETEPNDTPQSANGLSFVRALAIVRAAVVPASDLDYYSFRAPPGSRVWILVDTGGVPNPGANNSGDTIVALLGPDGTTVIEEDDDDGTSNGGDGSTEHPWASAIAGRTLTTGGVYYVQVRSFAPTLAIADPYRLLVLLNPNYVIPEDEPNDSPLTPNPLGYSNFEQVTTASLSPGDDIDYYYVETHAGDVLFIGIDADPERDGGTDVSVDLLTSDASAVLLSVDDSTTGVGTAESFEYVIPTTGFYLVRVQHASGFGTGTYHIAAALSSAMEGCVTTITSTLGADTPDHPSIHGTQDERPVRDGTPTQCGSETCAGTIPGGPITYDVYPFFNSSSDSTCVWVDVDAMTCDVGNPIFVVAYLGSYRPAELCYAYHADIGASPAPTGFFSFDVPPQTPFLIVVSEALPGEGCPAYKMRVQGVCDAVELAVDARSAPGTSSNLNGILETGEVVQVEPAWKQSERDLFQTFDTVEPLGLMTVLPTGWTATLAFGEPDDATWDTFITDQAGTNSAFGPAPDHVTDNYLDSPLFVPEAGSQLSFYHFFSFATLDDGGVVEISINGGAFQDITAAGGTFAGGTQSYTGIIAFQTFNPLAGRPAFTGALTEFATTTINMPPSSIGQSVRIRFRVGTDINSTPSLGWYLDTIRVGMSVMPLTGDASLSGPAGPTYTISDSSADYEAVLAGDITNCRGATGDCYQVSVAGPRPAAHLDAVLGESLSSGQFRGWKLHVGGSFNDVPSGNIFYRFIETLLHGGITAGGACGGYCPNDPVLRKQMAVFVLKARWGLSFIPDPAVGIFTDVPAADPFAPWIEYLFNHGIVAGCGPGPAYCPNNPVLRQQMPVFLIRTLLQESVYTPPDCEGLFADVPCSNPFAPWIEDVFRRGIAAGCGGGSYCPTSPTTRGQMAPFLVKTFGLVLYGP